MYKYVSRDEKSTKRFNNNVLKKENYDVISCLMEPVPYRLQKKLIYGY